MAAEIDAFLARRCLPGGQRAPAAAPVPLPRGLRVAVASLYSRWPLACTLGRFFLVAELTNNRKAGQQITTTHEIDLRTQEVTRARGWSCACFL